MIRVGIIGYALQHWNKRVCWVYILHDVVFHTRTHLSTWPVRFGKQEGNSADLKTKQAAVKSGRSGVLELGSRVPLFPLSFAFVAALNGHSFARPKLPNPPEKPKGVLEGRTAIPTVSHRKVSKLQQQYGAKKSRVPLSPSFMNVCVCVAGTTFARKTPKSLIFSISVCVCFFSNLFK